MICILCMVLVSGSDLSVRNLRKEVKQVLTRPELADGVWGISIYAPRREKTLLDINARVNFRPASNMKILTAYTAFQVLGASYAYPTEFAFVGEHTDGELLGDLVIAGWGDPSLSGNYVDGLETGTLIDSLIERLRTAGIRSVSGNLLTYEGSFDAELEDGSWEISDLGAYYGAAVNALAMNDAWSVLNIETDENGSARYHFVPAYVRTPFRFDLVHGDSTDLDLQRTFDGSFRITGSLASCSQSQITMAVKNPAASFANSLMSRLEQNGIQVEGSWRSIQNWPLDAKPLFTYYSEPLRLLMQTMMKISQNRYADCFAKSAAYMSSGTGSFDAFSETVKRQLEFEGLDTQGLSIRDGSGLSAQNYIRPALLVDVLNRALDTSFSHDWLVSFPVFGMDGTLKRRGNEITRGFVWAKTGYIYRARCLSGYVETMAGEPLVFSIMVNNYSCETAAVNQVQDELCSLMRRLKPPWLIADSVTSFELSQTTDKW